jgi:hypothetical protein
MHPAYASYTMCESKNGHAPEAPKDPLEGVVAERFKDRKPAPTFDFFPSVLSILSLVVMTASAVYMADQVSRPSVAFHQLKVGLHERPHQVTTFGELFVADLPCFFPGVLYDPAKPPNDFEHCNTNHQCQDKNNCDKEPSALWTRLPFYFTVWGAGLGGTFEFVLLCMGKNFQQDLNPFTQWIRRLRLLNLAFITSTVFFFAVCLTVPQENEVLLTILMYFFVAVAFALAPALFFGGLSSGGIDFIPPTILAIQAAVFIFVISREAVFGGKIAKYVLASAPVFQIAALLVTTATPMKSFGFHILSTLAGTSVYVALELAGNESPSFPTDLEAMLLGPETTRVLPFFVAAAAFGWFTMMISAPKVYQNFRSEVSYYLWSVVSYVLVGQPSQPKPYMLGTIYKTQAPKRITLQPYAQQHPYEVAPNLGIPAIYSENGYVYLDRHVETDSCH